MLIAAAPAVTFAQARNNALEFDGVDDHVDGAAANSNLPLGNSPRTIEAWINPRSGQNGTVFNYGAFAPNQRFGLLYIRQHLYLVGELNDIEGTTLIRPGAWTHVAITYDGVDARLYVNGATETGTPLFSSGPFNTTGGNWRAGSGSGIDGIRELFDGTVDEVKVWMYARTMAQVRFDMLGESCGGQGLVAYYDFDQGLAGMDNTSITTLDDRSSSASPGTLVNFGRVGEVSNFVDGAPVCSRTAKNQGAYLACVTQAYLTHFGADEQVGAIESLALQSACGK
jgi:hypothetical protein